MNIQPSNLPRKRFPSEKWAPVSAWTESLLTFGQRHLSWCHYGDIPPPPGATTGPGSQWESGRATGLSFLGIIRAKSPFLLSLYAASGPALPGGHGTKTIFTKPGNILRGYIEILHLCTHEKRLATALTAWQRRSAADPVFALWIVTLALARDDFHRWTKIWVKI